MVLKTTFGFDSKIVFKQLSKDASLTFSMVVTFKLLPLSFNGKTVSLYTIVLFTTLVCGKLVLLVQT